MNYFKSFIIRLYESEIIIIWQSGSRTKNKLSDSGKRRETNPWVRNQWIIVEFVFGEKKKNHTHWKNFEWKPIGLRTLNSMVIIRLWGDFFIIFFRGWKCLEEIPRAWWIEDTLLNFKVMLQAYPWKKFANWGDRKKNIQVVNWNLVKGAWLGQAMYSWGWLGESLPKWHRDLQLQWCAL